MNVQGLLAGLAARFPNQPAGPVSQAVQPAAPTTVLDGRITYAFLASRAFDPAEPDPEHKRFDRWHVELGIAAQSQTLCMYSPSPIVELNVDNDVYESGLSYSRSQVLAEQQVTAYMSMELIAPRHRVLDVGADLGYFVRALHQAGVFDAHGVEPNKASNWEYLHAHHEENDRAVSPTTEAMFDTTIDSTLENYLLHPDFQPVDVVTVNNFNPSFSSSEEMLESLPKALKAEPWVKAIVGVCGCDPHLATPSSPDYLGVTLSNYFRDVKFVSAIETQIGRDTGSVGGQLGFFIGRDPIRQTP